MKISELFSLFYVKQVIGDDQKEFDSVAPITTANANQIAFCSYKSMKGINIINNSNAGVILCFPFSKIERKDLSSSKTYLLVMNPRLAFIKMVTEFFVDKHDGKIIIHPTAVIYDNVKIGKGTIIHEYVVIKSNTVIGKNCIIRAGTVIGEEGFAFEKDENGGYIRFPHFGGVRIGNDVEIGSNTCIDKGEMGDTIIENGTKIDNLIHIGHNSIIGRNCILVALTQIGGSSVIGENTWFGMSSTVRNRTKIGKDSLIGAGAVVVKDVAEGTTVIGNPARPMKKKE